MSVNYLFICPESNYERISVVIYRAEIPSDFYIKAAKQSWPSLVSEVHTIFRVWSNRRDDGVHEVCYCDDVWSRFSVGLLCLANYSKLSSPGS